MRSSSIGGCSILARGPERHGPPARSAGQIARSRKAPEVDVGRRGSAANRTSESRTVRRRDQRRGGETGFAEGYKLELRSGKRSAVHGGMALPAALYRVFDGVNCGCPETLRNVPNLHGGEGTV